LFDCIYKEGGMRLEKSYKFKNIEANLIKLLYIILSNQPILKYIYYLDSDPQSHADVEINLLETGNIVLTLFDETILTEECVKIFLNPLQGDLRKQPLSDITFTLDIVMNNSLWILTGRGELRAYRIADEFAELVDGKNVAGIGDVEITRFQAFKSGTSYSGLSLLIKVNSSTMKGLR